MGFIIILATEKTKWGIRVILRFKPSGLKLRRSSNLRRRGGGRKGRGQEFKSCEGGRGRRRRASKRVRGGGLAEKSPDCV